MDISQLCDIGSAPGSAVPGAQWSADLVTAERIAAAIQGDSSAMFDLGVTYSTSGYGIDGDLIEAHKWFNLASIAGHDCAKTCRAEISEEMAPRDIAEAQRRARQWLSAISARTSS